jgi:RNA 3'-terminal phosphate cyclase (ATP)
VEQPELPENPHQRHFLGSGEVMLTIDGSMGEGGGQIVRSSLALALVTGKAVTLENIRARRKKPGLARQHLTAVAAAAEVGRAEVEGAAIGSQRLVFRPQGIEPGNYHFPVGTAGSTTLVLQTVLPALLVARGESNLVLEGGTHNPMAPPYDFLARAYLPLVNRMGPTVEAVLERPGFYPAGGGRMSVRIQPAEALGRMELEERGGIVARRVRALVANLPRHIAERECRTIAAESGWEPSSFAVEELKASRGPGNAVMIDVQSQHVCEVFTGFGELGVRAEQVALRAWHEACRYLASSVPVGEHLADQLLLPLGIAAHHGTGGGHFRTLALSQHATTHIDVLRQFMDIDVQVEVLGEDDCRVKVVCGSI